MAICLSRPPREREEEEHKLSPPGEPLISQAGGLVFNYFKLLAVGFIGYVQNINVSFETACFIQEDFIHSGL